MNILILGGTTFLGPHFIEAAQSRGHRITIFNRGKTQRDGLENVEKLVGDRDGNLDALKGRTDWDAVIDTCGYYPRIVRQSAELLADNVGHYVFISSISVYDQEQSNPFTEDSPVGTLKDPTSEEMTGYTYGPLKAYCEAAVSDCFGDRCTNIRPGLIVGPDDGTDRFTYWPVRVERGGEILVPAPTNAPVQVIDVRDLADFTILACEQKLSGQYNACGPDYTLTMRDMIDACARATNTDPQITWVNGQFLVDQGVQPWTDLPIWKGDSLFTTSNAKSIEAGLKFRPIGETITDLLEWHRARGDDYVLKAGISAEREAELLKAWHEV